MFNVPAYQIQSKFQDNCNGDSFYHVLYLEWRNISCLFLYKMSRGLENVDQLETDVVRFFRRFTNFAAISVSVYLTYNNPQNIRSW